MITLVVNNVATFVVTRVVNNVATFVITHVVNNVFSFVITSVKILEPAVPLHLSNMLLPISPFCNYFCETVSVTVSTHSQTKRNDEVYGGAHAGISQV